MVAKRGIRNPEPGYSYRAEWHHLRCLALAQAHLSGDCNALNIFRSLQPRKLLSHVPHSLFLPSAAIMAFLTTVVGPVSSILEDRSIGLLIGAGFCGFIVLAVVINVLQQLLFKNPTEPPVVFHWFPIIGSTITYGIDPYKFFFGCREKV